MITYEYPLNERIRTLLRLEDLFEKVAHFVRAEGSLEHHVALITLFEVLEVASRADLKVDLPNNSVTVETLKALLTLDAESWRENCAGIREYFEQFGDKLPHELREELEALEKAFAE